MSRRARRRIRVLFASHQRARRAPAAHHQLRYIAAGGLLAALALVALVLTLDRRSRRRAEPRAQMPGP